MTELTDRIEHLLADRVGAGEPGLAIGVYRDGELAEQVCAGLAVVEHAVPVTADTLFDIASASKQFTAACLLLLQRDGRLSLDDDVRRHLPALALHEPVTLRQCLTHTGGLREYYTLCALSGVPLDGITEERLLRLIEGQQDLDFAPDSAYSYSNSGYVLAAAVIRRITGRSVAKFATERVFAPLGMLRTHFRDDLDALVPGFAAGYAPDRTSPGRFRRADPVEEVVGDGGIVTSVRELAGWHAFLLSGHGLGADIRDGLLPRVVLIGGRTLDYANGIAHTGVAGRPGVRPHRRDLRLPLGAAVHSRRRSRSERAGQPGRSLPGPDRPLGGQARARRARGGARHRPGPGRDRRAGQGPPARALARAGPRRFRPARAGCGRPDRATGCGRRARPVRTGRGRAVVRRDRRGGRHRAPAGRRPIAGPAGGRERRLRDVRAGPGGRGRAGRTTHRPQPQP